MAELIPEIANRRAQRAFASTPVEQAKQELLWRSVLLAPSHGNTQPSRLVVTSNAAIRERVIEALNEGNRGWASAAPLFAALAGMPGHDRPARNRDGTTREMWAFETGIAAGNLMAEATALGLIAHPMSGFDEPAIRAAFQAPDEVRVLVVFAIGYPGDPSTLPLELQEKESAPQWRIPVENLVGIDRWAPEQSVSAREMRPR